MTSLREEIRAGLAAGTFRERLQAYCLDWRKHRSRYAIANVVGHAVEAGLADAVYDTLVDSEFRDLRRAGFGINALRADLQAGLDFFSREHLDLLRYVQVLFLEQRSAASDAAVVRAHQRHCQEFADFLQLDVPAHERHDAGVHRVLGRLFPLALTAKDNDAEVVGTVRLAGYEVGTWRCSCGARTGQARRYDHACPCGRVGGNGRLPAEPAVCTDCGQAPAYARCPVCGTRVTLDLFWRFRGGNVHPSAYRLAVTADLVVQRPGGPEEPLRLVLVQLPLMLGVREKDGEVVFEPPDLFWISKGGDSVWTSGQLIGLPDQPRYDRQKELRKILEAALRRTFQDRNGPRSLRNRLRKFLVDGQKKEPNLADGFTRGFEKRLARGVAEEAPVGELTKLIDLSRDCVVAASPLLRRNMVWVNRQLVRPGAFVAPCLTNVSVVLRRSSLGDDVLTPTPMGRPRGAALGDDGIVLPGRVVQPGDVLVGIQSPRGPGERTAEEKLLHAIFGRTDHPDVKDGSLEFNGAVPGRVLSVHVSLGRHWRGVEVPPAPGKFVDWPDDMPMGELARVAVTLVVAQPLEVGDSLTGEEGGTAVVCRIAGGQALARALGLPTEPDLVTAPDHPWAPPPAAGSAHTVRVGLTGSTLLGQEATARATGPYSLIAQAPYHSEGHMEAQRLTAADFRWLLEHGACRLALELYGPRCDCVEWRTGLYELLVKGDRRLADLRPAPLAEWRSPADCPSTGVRNWHLLLRAACLDAVLEHGCLTFRPLSAADILTGSCGEVKRPETINYRTYRPEKDGLFCERIFGPEKDWECACGKYRGMKYKGMVCDRCGVKVIHSRVRRQRMGHIELAAPVVHSWYFRGKPCLLGEALGLSAADLDEVIHYDRYVVTEAGSTPLRVGQLLSEDQYRQARWEYGDEFQADLGAEAIEALLRRLAGASGKEPPLAGAILRRLPVLPPDLRPLVLLDSGNFATSDLNDLYRRVINRSNRARKLIDLNAPEVILRDEKRRLQHSVEALLDNDRHPRPVVGTFHRPLWSLARHLVALAQRDGTLRDGMLRRRVDYSARTRLAADETPDGDTCLLPDRLAWELFQPLLITRLKATGQADTIKSAKKLIERRTEEAQAALEAVAAGGVVLAAPASGPWRLVALRTRLTPDLAVKVHPDLLERIGWDNLGQRVNLFAVLSAEAQQEALQFLLPSRLPAEGGKQAAEQVQPSPFDVAQASLIDELAQWSASERSFRLTPPDHFLLCAREAFDVLPGQES